MAWYDRENDKTVYQLGLTISELLNLSVMTTRIIANDDGYVGAGLDGAEREKARKAAVSLHERIKRLANAADDAGRARMVIETEATGAAR